jgi:hypothetical protein
MRTKTVGSFVLITLMVALMPFAMSAGNPSSSGTWKMNYDKSHYSPGPKPASLTAVVECDANDYKIDATGTDNNGKPIHVQFNAKFDGKDYPASGLAGADVVSVRRIDATTVEIMAKKDAKVVMLILSKTSKDGKTRTSTWEGITPDGKDVHNVVVYDKQ